MKAQKFVDENAPGAFALFEKIGVPYSDEAICEIMRDSYVAGLTEGQDRTKGLIRYLESQVNSPKPTPIPIDAVKWWLDSLAPHRPETKTKEEE
jgi:hypothetical protein